MMVTVSLGVKPFAATTSIFEAAKGTSVICTLFAALETSNFTIKLALIPFPPLTIIVELYDPTSNPVFGVTTKVSVLSTAKLAMDVFEILKIPVFPVVVTVRTPVG